MRNFSSDFAAHIKSGETSLCTCWKIERKDGMLFGFTDHDEALTFDGQTYNPASGFDGSQVAEKLGAQTDGADVLGVLDSELITETDIQLGRWDHASIETYRVNWTDPNVRAFLRRDTLGEIVKENGSFRAELRSLHTGLNRVAGRLYASFCDAEFGDPRCGVNTSNAAYRLDATIAAIPSSHLVELNEPDAFDPGWFTHGKANWTAGARNGLTDQILEHRVENGIHRLRFGLPIAEWVEIGDALTLIAGCDRLFGTCKNKFGNVVNFQGFPHIPGNDRVFRYPDQSDQLDGRALVK